MSARSAAGLSGCAPCRLCRHGHSASIPHAFAPAALRAPLASRESAQGPSPPRDAWHPFKGAEPAVPDWPSKRLALMTERGGYAPTCCDRLCKSVPSSTLAVRCPHVTKDGSPTRRPALPMELPHHASRTLPQAAAGGVLACRWDVGLARVRAQAGEAVMRGCRVGHVSIRDRRPVRPWLVVNPGGGAAAPWASWPQPSSENNFPAAARLPRAANSFRFQVLHGVATAARCGQPIPRRPVHNKDALARPCSTRKENHHG